MRLGGGTSGLGAGFKSLKPLSIFLTPFLYLWLPHKFSAGKIVKKIDKFPIFVYDRKNEIFSEDAYTMKRQHVSEAVIRRLPRYYRYLDDLHNKGVVRISSNSLGNKMGITASQIRQDLSCFGEFGQQGYGYNVKELRTEIGRILGIDKKHTIIIVGVGNLGHALMQNFHFAHNGFSLEAAFDISPALIGSEINGVLVRDLKELDDYCKNNIPDVAVLTVPQSVAQQTVDHLVELGVRGFWNFTNREVTSDNEEVRFESVHFADSLLTLSYHISRK